MTKKCFLSFLTMRWSDTRRKRLRCASDSIIRNSLFVIRYSAVRCLIQAIAAASLITNKKFTLSVLCGELFSISKFKLFCSKSFQVFPAKFIFAGKRFGGNDVGHHFLIQGVYDGTVQSFGNCHNHEGLI